MTDNTRLRIAMQKSGRLSDDSRELLARCGIKINLHTQRLIAMAENMPIDILRVRDDDIPGLVMDVKIRATLPCVVWISAAADFHWQRRLMKPGTARSP